MEDSRARLLSLKARVRGVAVDYLEKLGPEHRDVIVMKGFVMRGSHFTNMLANTLPQGGVDSH